MRPAHWLHDRDVFYKYLSPTAAQGVLETNSFRWSSPIEFNDPFDIGFDLHVDYDPSTIVQEIVDAQWAVYQGIEPTSSATPLGWILNELRTKKPSITRPQFDQRLLPRAQETISKLGDKLPELHSQIKHLLQSLKVFCLAERPDNILMWSHYCLNHSGLVLEVRCLATLDSMWGGAMPINYSDCMPRLLNRVELVEYLAGKFPLEDKLHLDKIVMCKALDWSYEKEWRILHFGMSPHQSFTELPFAVYEISGIYFGCRSSAEFRGRISELRTQKYSHANLFQAKKAEREFRIEFEKLP